MSNTMPTQTFEAMPPMPQHQSNAVPPKQKKRWLMPVLVAVAVLLGFAVGGAAVPPKTVEVTKEVPVDKIVTKEVTKEVPTTPKECTDALDYAATIFTMNADAIGTMSDMVQHAGHLDADGLNADNAKLDKQTQELSKIKQPYQDAVAACRAS